MRYNGARFEVEGPWIRPSWRPNPRGPRPFFPREHRDDMADLRARPRWPKDNGMDIPELEWESAVNYLVRHVTLQTWQHVQEAMGEKGLRWYVGEGQRLGRAVRYLLTKGGFRWGTVCMQANWFRLLEEGSRRVFFVQVEVQEN